MTHITRFERIINLTPHELTIWDNRNEIVGQIASAGSLRVEETRETVDEIEGIPVIQRGFADKINGLPEMNLEELYLYVSLLAGLSMKAAGIDISRVLIPGEEHRDSEGRIDGILSFGKLTN